MKCSVERTKKVENYALEYFILKINKVAKTSVENAVIIKKIFVYTRGITSITCKRVSRPISTTLHPDNTALKKRRLRDEP